MKDISALLMGILPWFILRYTGMIPADDVIIAGIVVASLLVLQGLHFSLNRWPHHGILTVLALGLPAMAWVFVAAQHPSLLLVFYGLSGLGFTSAFLSAWLNGQWGWEQLGINIGFFATGLVVVGSLSALSGLEGLQAGVLTGCAYGITRLTGVDLLSWMKHLPGLIVKGMEKIWY